MKLSNMPIVMLLLACNPTHTDSKVEGKKIMQLSREWSNAASSNHIDRTVSFWADEAILMSAGQPVLRGKPAIRQMVEDSYKIPGFKISWEPQSAVVSKSGDLAYLIEKSHISFSDSTGKIITQDNNGISIWSKQNDGSWKNVVDISTPATSK
jgi:ketosteroid isomerase-like protein